MSTLSSQKLITSFNMGEGQNKKDCVSNVETGIGSYRGLGSGPAFWVLLRDLVTSGFSQVRGRKQTGASVQQPPVSSLGGLPRAASSCPGAQGRRSDSGGVVPSVWGLCPLMGQRLQLGVMLAERCERAHMCVCEHTPREREKARTWPCWTSRKLQVCFSDIILPRE